jgi:murein DD-endopeptidase MepM/ murein hydrolase activator NlpD
VKGIRLLAPAPPRRNRPRAGIAGAALTLLAGVAALGYAVTPLSLTHLHTSRDTSAVLRELETQGGADMAAAAPRPARKLADEASGSPPGGAEPPPAATAEVAGVRSALREPAPAEALAVGGFRPISGAAPASQRQSSAPPSVASSEWSVALTAAPADLGAALLEAFAAKGIRVLPPGSEPQADAVLALTAGSVGAAWYCDSPRAGSALWASAVLDSLRASSDQAPPAQFDCGALQARWPRTPAALVQVPAKTDAVAFAKSLAGAVSSYFGRYGTATRAARASARLAWPATGPITSPYGPDHPLGIDIGQWSGPVRAATDGTVYFAGGDPCCSYGRFVVIDSAAGIRTIYGHLDTVEVKTGQRVKAGQTLGQVGCTGACHGTHLHFEVIDNGLRQDPTAYLP